MDLSQNNDNKELSIEEDDEIIGIDPMLWKRRYQTSCEFYKQSKAKERNDKIIRYLHNDWSIANSKEAAIAPFLNQFFISLKTLLTMIVAHNPEVILEPDNDFVYEYDKNNQVIMDEMGQPIKHDMNEVAPTLQVVLKKRLEKVVKFKNEMRKFLRDAITFNRGIFIIGHTLNTDYEGSFTRPTYHAFIKSVPPYKIKRQAGTKRIDEGTYFFYEYEVPYSHLKGNTAYNQELIKRCRKKILEEIKINDINDFTKEDAAGYFDDVQYVAMHNGYDLLTGEVHIFAEGVDEPLKTIKPEYTFKNPSVEFVPNLLFQPEQNEPVSDLMMGEHIVKNAQIIVDKAVSHVKKFNTGYNIEKSALLDKKQVKRIESNIDRSFWVFEDNALSGGKVQPRTDLQLGPEVLNMVEYLFGYFQKILAVYDFQQGGRTSEDETATKTQAKLQTSNFKGGDMSEMVSDACNEALEKYLEVLVKTTDVKEVVKIIGDAGETEYRDFDSNQANKGQFHCKVDLQSMGKVNEDVKNQQLMKLYELVKSDPDPQVQQRVNKVELFSMIAKYLGANNTKILRKIPDTRGMDEQQFMDYIKQQIIKAKQETAQAIAGAQILPPSPDDDPDIHLNDHLGKAQELKMQAANAMDPLAQQQAQAKIDMLLQHAQIHIQAKQEKQQIEELTNPGTVQPQIPQIGMQGGGQVSNNPPKAGNVAGQVQRTIQ